LAVQLAKLCTNAKIAKSLLIISNVIKFSPQRHREHGMKNYNAVYL